MGELIIEIVSIGLIGYGLFIKEPLWGVVGGLLAIAISIGNIRINK